MAIEENLLKTHFVGRDGYRYWMGQVAPEKAQGKQIDGGGWGNRLKVRIMGYHPEDEAELPDKDLPWSLVLLGTTDGSGGGGRRRSIRISPGDAVYGFFLDGDNAQIPVIQGVMGRTLLVTSNQYAGPFQPYTGYTSKIKNDGGYFGKGEANEENSASTKMPRNISRDQAASISAAETTAFDGIGDVIVAASNAASSTVRKISAAVTNFVKQIKSITDNPLAAVGSIKQKLNAAVSGVTSQISNLSTGLVGNMVNGIYETMAPIANAGLKMLYQSVYSMVLAATKSSRVAHMAGVAAQRQFESPLQKIQDSMTCITKDIVGSMGDSIKGLLDSVAKNVKRMKSCVNNQFMGGLMNQIIGGIQNGLSGLLGGVDKIMPGFNLADQLRSKAEGLLGQVFGNTGCVDGEGTDAGDVLEYVVGNGPKGIVPVPIQSMLSQANNANNGLQNIIQAGQTALNVADGALGVFDFLNPASSQPGFDGECSTAEEDPEPPEVQIFGSSGEDAAGKLIMGSVVGAGSSATASVIGVEVTNGGSGYKTPPFVEISDAANYGYGAIARSVIDYDEDSPTYQQVIEIYLVSEGENYPVGKVEKEDPSGSKPPYVIGKVTVINPGQGYSGNDTVMDGVGTAYGLNVDDSGRTVSYTHLPLPTTPYV